MQLLKMYAHVNICLDKLLVNRTPQLKHLKSIYATYTVPRCAIELNIIERSARLGRGAVVFRIYRPPTDSLYRPHNH